MEATPGVTPGVVPIIGCEIKEKFIILYFTMSCTL